MAQRRRKMSVIEKNEHCSVNRVNNRIVCTCRCASPVGGGVPRSEILEGRPPKFFVPSYVFLFKIKLCFSNFAKTGGQNPSKNEICGVVEISTSDFLPKRKFPGDEPVHARDGGTENPLPFGP